MSVTLYKISEVYSRLLGTNGIHVKADNRRLTVAGSCCHQNLNMKIARRHLADYVKNLRQEACLDL